MSNKIINVDFSKNKRRHKKNSLFSSLKNILKTIFSSAKGPDDPENDKKKIIYYKKGIS
ncbi:hypothetical protein [Clostridium magnum]|uniref:Uncharacterized protein n=1 Tax=Clostridium magnum DSM 2767 TaxID=1121326 RepID=A0A161YI48_9CLOT|nr:hypothetical protein [Clostridium magnum]KZL89992.1 hypothetical protein CLMAG_44760 [Clostridium magnum DSM 2767]SHI86606.1 hypothetical protein SAMN02745944_04969 [Clostridium magnum DSM 2767]